MAQGHHLSRGKDWRGDLSNSEEVVAVSATRVLVAILFAGACSVAAQELKDADLTLMGMRLGKDGLSDVLSRILLVEQNVAVSLKISQRAYVLENGRVAMSGSGTELLHNDRVRQAYLGL